MAVNQVELLRLAMSAVSDRALIALTACMAFSLFCWSMWAHGWIELAIAGTFSALVFLPVLLKGGFRAQNEPPSR